MKNLYLDMNILDKNDIRDFLKENLRINFNIDSREDTLNIELSLKDEIISSDYVDLEFLNTSRNIEETINYITDIISKIPFIDEESKETIEKLNKIIDDIKITPQELNNFIWFETYDILKKYLLDEDGYFYDARIDYGVIILSGFLKVNKNSIKSKFKRKGKRKVV